MLRDLLARYLEIQPGLVRFVYNALGKPGLSLEFGSRLTFNISHSAGLSLIAVTAGAKVGVDLEYICMPSDSGEIARNFFSPAEVDHLDALPSHLYADGFFRCW